MFDKIRFYTELNRLVKYELGIELFDSKDMQAIAASDCGFEELDFGVSSFTSDWFILCWEHVKCDTCPYGKNHGPCTSSKSNPIYQLFSTEENEQKFSKILMYCLVMDYLPCPFCGSKKLKIDGNVVRCVSCGAQVPKNNWNKRCFQNVREPQQLSGSVCLGCRQRDEWIRYYKTELEKLSRSK